MKGEVARLQGVLLTHFRKKVGPLLGYGAQGWGEALQ